MKVKLFEYFDRTGLEEQINEWLASNPGIQIKYITQSQEAITEISHGYVLIAIWYERPLH